jgi:hypothetical protein
LNVKNRIRHASLLEDVLVFLKFQDRFARPYLGEKGFGIELVIGDPRLVEWSPLAILPRAVLISINLIGRSTSALLT